MKQAQDKTSSHPTQQSMSQASVSEVTALNTIRTTSSFFTMPATMTFNACMGQPPVGKAMSIDTTTISGRMGVGAITALPLLASLSLNMLYVSDIQEKITASVQALDDKYRTFFEGFDALLDNESFKPLQKFIALNQTLFTQLIAQNKEAFSEGCYDAKTAAIMTAWLALSMNPCSTIASPAVATVIQVGQVGAQTTMAACVLRSQNETIQGQINFFIGLQKRLNQIDKCKDLITQVLMNPAHPMYDRLTRVLNDFNDRHTLITAHQETEIDNTIALHNLCANIASTLDLYHNEMAFSLIQSGRYPSTSSMNTLNASRESLSMTNETETESEETNNSNLPSNAP